MLDIATSLLSEEILQVILAFILGAILGWQREYVGKAAGLRTYSLVAMGSTLFTIVSHSGFDQFITDPARLDPSRTASNIVTGIGFLGAGVIILRGTKVEGLTTAAGLWVAAAIGMAVGTKMYALAVVATVVAFLILEVLNRAAFENWLSIRGKKKERID